MLWPDLPATLTRDRFRTALAQVRAALGDAVEWSGGKTLLCLTPIRLVCDLWDAQNTYRLSTLAEDPLPRQNALESLVDLIQPGFLPDHPETLTSERQRWHERLLESLLQLSELAEARADREQALHYAERALECAPFDERIWRTLLQLYAASGRHVEIGQRLGNARQALRKEADADFSSSLRAYAQQVRRQGVSPRLLTMAQESSVNRAFAAMIADAPEEAAAFLGSSSFRAEIFRSPDSSIALLEQVLKRTEGASDARMNCAIGAMMGYTILGRYDRYISLGDEVLAHDSDPARLRAAATMVATAHLAEARWEEARAYNEKAVRYAEQIGNKPGIEIAHAQRAIFKWQIEADASVVEELTAIADRLREFSEHNARVGRATIELAVGNILVYTGNWADAKRHCLNARTLAEECGHSPVATQCWVSLGLVDVAEGNFESGIDALARGITEVNSTMSSSQVLFELERVAYAMAVAGRTEAGGEILTAARALRQELNLVAPPAQQLFLERATRLVSTPLPSCPNPPKSVKELVRTALSHLEDWRTSISRL